MKNNTSIVQDLFTAAWRPVQDTVYETSVEKGWWNENRNPGELIALMHSELSEALEALRVDEDAPSDHIPEFTALEEEFADVIIRIMDYAAANGLRIPQAISAKVEFNKTRPVRHGGKKF